MKTDNPQNHGTGFAAFLRRHPWLTTGVALLLLAGVLFFCVEWRAEHRWQRYATEARARGAKLEFSDFVRPEIPEAQNFAALPMLKKVPTNGENEPPFKLPKWRRTRPAIVGRKTSTYDDIPPALGNAAKGEKTNWKDWQDYFLGVGFLTETTDDPARDVLRALEHYAPQFQQWSEWRTTRPQCRFPVDSVRGPRIPANLLTHPASMFNLRLAAHLAVRDPAAAYADFQDGLQVARVFQSAPSMTLGLLRVGTLRFLVEEMANGLRDHTWPDAELKEIQADLAALRLWDDYCADMEASRCELNMATEKLMNTPFRERARMENAFGYRLAPRSVFRDNELRLNRYIDELTVRGNAPEATFNPDRQTPSSGATLTRPSEKKHYFLFDLFGDGYSVPERQYLKLQILLDQARLACALERFRLAHGAYPATLAELMPEFIQTLPIDIYARAPYRYRQIGTASFQLYSVGENRKDDGGATPRVGDQPPLDMEWPFAPTLEK